MRMMRTSLVVLATAMAVVVSGCGSAVPTITAGELFQEYARSSEVKNDRFPSPGVASEDRIANFAAYGGPEALQASLLRTFECDENGDSGPEYRCELNKAVTNAAREINGSGEAPLGRSVLVKHADGSLELLTLYVAQARSGKARLIDRTGRTYTDLDDFRANNDLLTEDDTMLTLKDITSVPGEGEVVAVTGHTPSTWEWWLVGGITVVAVLLIGLAVVRRIRNARGPDTASIITVAPAP